VTEAAALDVDEVQRRLASPNDGLSDAEAAARLRAVGANAVRSHGSGALAVLLRQLRSPLLVLLGLAAVASAFVGERTDTAVIGAILALSVGLGFVNDYRAEKAAAALHDQIRHSAIAVREGRARSVDVTQVVPGDVVELRLGEVVPADMRLTDVVGLECDETVLTGESLSRAKQVAPVPTGLALGDLASCALMGTVVQGGTGRGVVVATGAATEFGRIAVGLGERHAETDFQVGLRRFSLLLVRVASVLTAFVVVANVALRRPVLDAVLFALAIAVGITPQLLPAVVSTSLAAGARQLSRRKVLVKRLMCIEDLGNIQVLFTDKTGTLTEGRISLQSALDPAGKHAERTHLLGLL
jgi:Mg2+-importing ATPase